MSIASQVGLSACVWVPAFVVGASASVSRPLARLSGSAGPVAVVAIAAAGWAALSAAAQLSLLFGHRFLALGPPWVGAAPWLAGEIFCGPSRHQDESFAAAIIAAYAAGLIAACTFANVLCQAFAAAAAASVAYLSVRGGTHGAGESDA